MPGIGAFASGPARRTERRTKGKDERGVGYVKNNAIAGRTFESFAELEAHLERWTREVADQRIHGTTGEAPAARFGRDEKAALRPLPNHGPFLTVREVARKVSGDCAVVDGNAYSVPWRLIGEKVQVTLSGDQLRVLHAGKEVAVHRHALGRKSRVVDRAHFVGLAASAVERCTAVREAGDPSPATLLRPLADYELAAGGSW